MDKTELTIEDIKKDVYLHYKNHNEREMEHEIGRLLNMKSIIEEIKNKNISGDFIEFGVYQGFSLIWLARFRDMFNLNDRKIIGIDSFEGLPNDSTIWKKKAFEDTSLNYTLEQLSNIQNIFVLKRWFDDPLLLEEVSLISKDFALIHIDCDLGSSFRTAISMMLPNIKSGQFILLDDWGVIDDEIPKSFREWELENKQIEYKVRYTTNITRYIQIK